MNSGGQDRGHRRHEQPRARKARRQPVGDHTPQQCADAADQNDDRGLDAGLVGSDAIEAIEVARQPRPDRRTRRAD